MAKSSQWLMAGLFVLHALPFLTRPALIGGDEPHFALMAHSIAVDRDIELGNNYDEVANGSAAAGRKRRGQQLTPHLRGLDDKVLFTHPLGLPALAAPLVALQQRLLPGSAPDWTLGLFGLTISFAGLIAGYRLLLPLVATPHEAGFLAFAFYFATPLWFYSRLFFTEGYAVAMTILAVYTLTRRRWVVGSILLGALLLLKEVYLLLIAPVVVGVWILAGLRRAVLVGLGPLAALLVWGLKNEYFYGHFLVPFQAYRADTPIEGAISLLLDVQHGLLPFAPILLLAPFALRTPQAGPAIRVAPLAWLSAASFVAVTAPWPDWGGGTCYGPRLVLPAVLMMALPLTLAWNRLRGHRLGRATFVVLTGLGFAIQMTAALHPFHAFLSARAGDLLSHNPLEASLALLLGVAIGLFLTAEAGDSPEPEADV
jgi:hypothetical protein